MCAGGKKFVSEIKLECGNRIKKGKKNRVCNLFLSLFTEFGKIKNQVKCNSVCLKDI